MTQTPSKPADLLMDFAKLETGHLEDLYELMEALKQAARALGSTETQRRATLFYEAARLNLVARRSGVA